jgi:hypothetical protein
MLQWVVVKAAAPSRALAPLPVSDVTWSSAGTLGIQLKSCAESKLDRGSAGRAGVISVLDSKKKDKEPSDHQRQHPEQINVEPRVSQQADT